MKFRKVICTFGKLNRCYVHILKIVAHQIRLSARNLDKYQSSVRIAVFESARSRSAGQFEHRSRGEADSVSSRRRPTQKQHRATTFVVAG